VILNDTPIERTKTKDLHTFFFLHGCGDLNHPPSSEFSQKCICVCALLEKLLTSFNKSIIMCMHLHSCLLRQNRAVS